MGDQVQAHPVCEEQATVTPTTSTTGAINTTVAAQEMNYSLFCIWSQFGVDADIWEAAVLSAAEATATPKATKAKITARDTMSAAALARISNQAISLLDAERVAGFNVGAVRKAWSAGAAANCSCRLTSSEQQRCSAIVCALARPTQSRTHLWQHEVAV